MARTRTRLTPALLAALQREFRLAWRGIHGVPHWTRVRINGLALARATGARADVVELFAFLHDSQRVHDGGDRRTAMRVAAFVHRCARRCCAARRRRRANGSPTPAVSEHVTASPRPRAAVQTCWAIRGAAGRASPRGTRRRRPGSRRLCTIRAAPGARLPRVARPVQSRRASQMSDEMLRARSQPPARSRAWCSRRCSSRLEVTATRRKRREGFAVRQPPGRAGGAALDRGRRARRGGDRRARCSTTRSNDTETSPAPS